MKIYRSHRWFITDAIDDTTPPRTTKMPSILIINPNSTEAMTVTIENIVKGMHLPGKTEIVCFTAPPGSPKSINSPEDAKKSAEVCLNEILQVEKEFDAFIVACFGPHHPLISALREHVHPGKIVTGVYEEAVHAAKRSYGESWGVLTTGKVWGDVISEDLQNEHYWGTEACGVHANELHNKEARAKVEESVRILARDQQGAVILGCVGFGELGKVVEYVGEGRLKVIDCVKAGVGGVIGTLIGAEKY